MDLFLRLDEQQNCLPAPKKPRLSKRLLSDKPFMMKTLVRHPTALCDVGANLIGDTDLFIAALSSPSGLNLDAQ